MGALMMSAPRPVGPGPGVAPIRIQQYVVFAAIASGGMGTVHLGKIVRPGGFRKTVAIKRPHPHLLGEATFVDMLLDEARLTSSVSHPNVVTMIDVVRTESDILLVMEYVHGLPLSGLLRHTRKLERPVPVPVGAAIVSAVLHGLHAAHEAKGASGQPLDLVHRDVSPQNILVGADGVPRVVDFGIAKASDRLQSTRDGAIKGKLAYLAPEQFAGLDMTRKVDIFAAGIVLWEVLTGRLLFAGKSDAETVTKALRGSVPPPSALVPEARAFDPIVLRALRRAPSDRFATALEMAEAIERAVSCATPREVGAWATTLGAAQLAEREALLASMESSPLESHPPRDSQATVVLPTPIDDVFSVHGLNSDIHGDTTREPGPDGRKKVLLAIGGIASALAISLAGIHARSAPLPVANAAPVTSPPAPLPDAPATAVVETPPPAATQPDALPIHARLPSPRATASAAPPAKAPSNARRASKAATECNPPYDLDARGIKRYKPQCY
jgi:serine/threonine-protein kinase